MWLSRKHVSTDKPLVVVRHDSIVWTREDAAYLNHFLSTEPGKKLVAMIEDNAFARFLNGESTREEVNAVLSVNEYMRHLSPEQDESAAQKTEGRRTTIQTNFAAPRRTERET